MVPGDADCIWGKEEGAVTEEYVLKGETRPEPRRTGAGENAMSQRTKLTWIPERQAAVSTAAKGSSRIISGKDQQMSFRSLGLVVLAQWEKQKPTGDRGARRQMNVVKSLFSLVGRGWEEVGGPSSKHPAPPPPYLPSRAPHVAVSICRRGQ